MKKKFIGHRGAAGLELENTAASLKKAVELNLDAIELDVRLTKDKQLVLSHDEDLEAMANDGRFINDLTLKELKQIRLINGSRYITLNEALKITGDMPVIVEVKDRNSAQKVYDEIKKFPKKEISVGSRNLEELAVLRSLDSRLYLYYIDFTRALENVHVALQYKINGVGMNYWILNPLTYWYARKKGLKIYVYTLNSRLIARFLGWLYPDVAICTDHPEWFVDKRVEVIAQPKGRSKHERRIRSHRASS